MSRSIFAALGVCLAMAVPQAGQALILSTTSEAFGISPVTGIAANPLGATAVDECRPVAAGMSEPARLLSEGGWIVTGEAQLAEFELVSFAAKATALGGGACAFAGGQIAVWQGGAFVALIQAAKADDALIGQIRETDGTRVDILSGAATPAPSGHVAYDAAAEELFVEE